MSEILFPLTLNVTDKFPPLVLTLTVSVSKCPEINDAMADAVTPVPHDKVSSSTPLSKVLTYIPLFNLNEVYIGSAWRKTVRPSDFPSFIVYINIINSGLKIVWVILC